LLRTDNVNDSLSLVAETEVGKTKVFHVLFEGKALQAGIGFLDELADARESLA
jgi:hypothetical protein